MLGGSKPSGSNSIDYSKRSSLEGNSSIGDAKEIEKGAFSTKTLDRKEMSLWSGRGYEAKTLDTATYETTQSSFNGEANSFSKTAYETSNSSYSGQQYATSASKESGKEAQGYSTTSDFEGRKSSRKIEKNSYGDSFQKTQEEVDRMIGRE